MCIPSSTSSLKKLSDDDMALLSSSFPNPQIKGYWVGDPPGEAADRADRCLGSVFKPAWKNVCDGNGRVFAPDLAIKRASQKYVTFRSRSFSRLHSVFCRAGEKYCRRLSGVVAGGNKQPYAEEAWKRL
ncbi:uncharacterized [Tachysurus ichikawai]